MSATGTHEVIPAPSAGHPRWVRLSHWIGAASVLTLAVTGFVILMTHPRLYWGETGNDLTPALIELPVSRNYKHGGWQLSTPSFPDGGAAASSVRTYDILNQNSWGRSLHFIAAWFLVVTGLVYLVAAIAGGHARRDLLPRARELAPGPLGRTSSLICGTCRGRAAARRTTCCRSSATASSCSSPCRS